MPSLIEHIAEEHLTPDMQLVADVCGIDVARKLMAELPGTRIHIPHPRKLDSLVRAYIAKRRAEEASPRTIAKELDMSVRFVMQCWR